jgi:DNA-directed RNA polymerase subunit alpha
VLHEFTTVPGVKEDVTDLILNLKELVVSSESDEPVVMYLRKQGPGAVTAADIAPPAGVEVHSPDLHIATLNGKGRLEIELTVERGRGYVSAVQNKQAGQEIGRIPVDSIYSPVLKVTYKVEATRVEQRTDFDRLVLDVETKSSMTPRDAVASPARPWSACSAWRRSSTPRPRASTSARRRPTPPWPADLALPIEEMDLTVRSYNCLKREGIHSVGELVSARGRPARHPQLRREVDRRGQGQAARHGLALKDSPPGFDPSQIVNTWGTDETGQRRRGRRRRPVLRRDRGSSRLHPLRRPDPRLRASHSSGRSGARPARPARQAPTTVAAPPRRAGSSRPAPMRRPGAHSRQGPAHGAAARRTSA